MEQRPSSTKASIKGITEQGSYDKWQFETPNHSTGSKLSEKMTTVSHRSEGEYESNVNDFNHDNSKEQLCSERSEIEKKLSKEEEKNFIFQHFFKKLEKVLYSEHSELLDSGEIKDYEKLQIHLEDMVKRVEKGTKYNKLAAVPVIYKKSNTVTTMTVTHKTVKK